METVTVKINGREYEVPAGIKIIDAARIAKIDIPTLCYLKDVNEIGACRLCLVEVKGARGLMAACVTTVSDGMEIWTNTPRVVESRKTNLELILSTHKKECLSCIRSNSCELQKLCRDLGVTDENRFEGKNNEYEKDERPLSSFVTTTNVSFAAVALPLVRICRALARSKPSTVALMLA